MQVYRARTRRFLVTAVFVVTAVAQFLFVAQLWPQQPSDPKKADAATGNEETAKTSGAATPSLINENQLLGLPLNGRSYSQLATLQAGVSDSSSSSASRGVGGGNLSVSGSRPTSNNFLLDGTTIMNSENQVPRSAAGVQLGSDTVFQVQVLSSGYGPEYGRSSGGVLNSITRSGTSQIHGSAFEYFRNSKLDARNFFDKESQPPPFKRNQFGFSLTGPVKKDRTFFLLTFEGLRDRLTESNVSFFPDEDARHGFPTASGQATVPVAAGVLPYFNVIPVPNDRREGDGIGRNVAPQFLPTNESYFTVRVDHKISDHDSLFVRYTFDDATGEESQGTHLFSTLNTTRQQYLTAVGTHIFSLRALDVIRFGYTRPHDEATSLYGVPIPRDLYFLSDTDIFGQIMIPGLSTFGPTSNIPRADNLQSFQFSNQVIVQQGAHGLKFGGELHRYGWDIFSDWQKGGVWSFNNLVGFLQGGPVGTGLAVALPGADNHRQYQQFLAAFYAQDEYRLSPRLLLSAGVRYEFVTKIKDRLRKEVFIRDIVRSSQVEYGEFFPNNPSLKNIAPRLGFTWLPWGRSETVISGGFGLYYDAILGYVASSRRSSAPFYNIAVNPNLDRAYFPNALEGAVGVPFMAQVFDYDGMKSSQVMRYNLTLQRPLPGAGHLQASYVGSRGNHLFRRFEANQFPVPTKLADGSLFFPKGAGAVNREFGSLTIINADAQSFYNALQVSANRSFSRNLSLQGSYTFSKSVDDSTLGHQTNTGQYGLDRLMDRALSDFDIRHRLVFNYFYNLPWGGGQHFLQHGVLSKILGNWRLGGIVTFRTGTPFSVLANARYKDYLFAAIRPNLISGASNNPVKGTTSGCGRVKAGQELGTPDLYFDPCAFSVPAAGTVGNTGRNTLTAPSVFNIDMSLQREFLLNSKHRLQFRADVFNIQNHTNFSAPSAVVFSGETGARTSTAGIISKTATTSRQIQFALRLSF
ncbi:MAG: TonB-dependent receptor [Acidobacteria bacterium]|nr:TonB-dependent receptor [Acidobacteriota bacterium]